MEANPTGSTSQNETDDVNIKEVNPLIPPSILMDDVPLTPAAAETVRNARQGVQNILDGKDDRFVVVVGPCSIHDPEAAIEYAKLLAPLVEEYKKDLLIIMRYLTPPYITLPARHTLHVLFGSFN